MANKPFKPMKGETIDLDSLKFPLLASPKLDGIRCVNVCGYPKTYTLKDIPNHFIRNYLNNPHWEGLDGELVIGEPTDSNLMQQTSSGVMSRDGDPDFKWYVFDDFTYPDSPFSDRLLRVETRVKHGYVDPRVVLWPHLMINSLGEYLTFRDWCFGKGYEGVCTRSPEGAYKFGRSTLKQQWLLKDKPFIDSECIIIGFEERMHNTNEEQRNDLGYMKRSTAKAGMVPAGMLGKLIVRHPDFEKSFKIGTGTMSHEHLVYWWQHRDELIGRICTFKYMNHGIVEVPRHGQFKAWRDTTDMEEADVTALVNLMNNKA